MEPPFPSDLPPPLAAALRALTRLAPGAREAELARLCAQFPAHAAAVRGALAGMDTLRLGDGVVAPSLEDRLSRLAGRAAIAGDRYEVGEEIGRGGMGAVLRAHDLDIGRTLAMKRVLTAGDGSSAAAPVDSTVVHRLVEEAQITGQLDHPGVVPVHDLGLDPDGRVYFTMRLVKGRTADVVFALARERAEGWTLMRGIEVLVKVCDTLAYAHAKGVVHRDVKPSNVMVGRFGEVYVMDWGLAKVLGRPDTRDLRVVSSTTISRVRTDHSRELESDPDTPLRTMDGAIVGTPCFMPPEQAQGRIEEVGARSDVYAVGGMLYALLTGHSPYLRSGERASPYMILSWVRDRPPDPVVSLAPAAPPELVAICERAMAREPRDRYAGMLELADDLRAYSENRVVQAYRTGARAELWSWVRRNRGFAAGLAATLLAVVGGGLGALGYARQADLARTDAEHQKQLANDERAIAVRALEDYREEQRQKAELEGRLRTDRLAASRDAYQQEFTARQRAEAEAKLTVDMGLVATIDAQLLPAEMVPGLDPQLLATTITKSLEHWQGEPGWQALLRQRWNQLAGAAVQPPANPGEDNLVLAGAMARAEGDAAARAGHLAEAWRRYAAAGRFWHRAGLPEQVRDRNTRDAVTLLVEPDMTATARAELQAELALGDGSDLDLESVWPDVRAAAAGSWSWVASASPTDDMPRLLRVAALMRAGRPALARALAEDLQRDTASARDAIAVSVLTAESALAVHETAAALAALHPPVDRYGALLPSAFDRRANELLARCFALDGNADAAAMAVRAALAPGAAEPAAALRDRCAASAGLEVTGSQRDATAERHAAAAASVVATDAATALRELDASARAFRDWLVDYARFAEPFVGPAELARVRRLAQSCLRTLAACRPGSAPSDVAAVWRIVETYRDPVGVVLGTRPREVRGPGDGGKALAAARATWLLARVEPPEKARGAAHVERLLDEMQRHERRLRQLAPAYASAVLPYVEELDAVRGALSPATALIVLVRVGEQVLAVAATPATAAWLVLPMPASRAPEAVADWGGAILAPVVRSLGDAAKGLRTIWFVPDRALAAVPFEWCPVATETPGEPLVMTCDVGYATSATAFVAKIRQRQLDAGVRHGGALAVVARVADPDRDAWCAAALAAFGPNVRRWSFYEPDGKSVAADRLESLLPKHRAVAVSVPTSFHGPDGSQAIFAGVLDHWRDASMAADLLLLRAEGAADSRGEAAMATQAAFAWSGGAETVITVAPGCGSPVARTAVEAAARALADGANPVAAWSEALRAATRRGGGARDFQGVRIWSARR